MNYKLLKSRVQRPQSSVFSSPWTERLLLQTQQLKAQLKFTADGMDKKGWRKDLTSDFF